MVIPKDASRLKLVLYPAPALRKKCGKVAEVDGAVHRLATRMIAVMHESRGVGLAAPQLGLPMRVFVCNHTGEPGDDAVYINPVLLDPDGVEEKEEGCLSIPEVGVLVRRAARITIDAINLDGEPVRLEADGLLARIWQHEHDHLEGKLIIDNMSETDEIANRRAIKQLKADYAKAHPK